MPFLIPLYRIFLLKNLDHIILLLYCVSFKRVYLNIVCYRFLQRTVLFCFYRTYLRSGRMAMRFGPMRAGHVQVRWRKRLRRLQRRNGMHERDVLIDSIPVRQRPVCAVHVEMRLRKRLRRRFRRRRLLCGKDLRLFPSEFNATTSIDRDHSITQGYSK